MLSSDYLEGYILGLTEGEGCFSVALQRYIDRRPRKTRKKSNIKRPHLFGVKPVFVITISIKDVKCLELVRDYFGVGNVYVQKRFVKSERKYQDVGSYRAQGFDACQKVRKFFEEQQFMTKKVDDFNNWARCLDIIASGKHVTKEGILEICDIRAKMNYRSSKCKWGREGVEKVFAANPEHILFHFDEKQDKLLHNNSFNYLKHLESKQGNNKEPRDLRPIHARISQNTD